MNSENTLKENLTSKFKPMEVTKKKKHTHTRARARARTHTHTHTTSREMQTGTS